MSSLYTQLQLPLPVTPISLPFLVYTMNVPAFAQAVLSSGRSLSLLLPVNCQGPFQSSLLPWASKSPSP